MQFCCANHTSRHLSIIETDSQHKIKFKQITIKAFDCILHRNSKVEQRVKVLVRVVAISRVQAAGAHVGGANRLDLLDALELVAQKQLVEVCKWYLSGEFSSQL